MKALLKRLKTDVFGGTAMEYGLILALMFVAMAGALEGFANINHNIWTNVSNAMSNAVAIGTGG
jgi:pilus assembly protein Flp/PilA